MIGVIYVVEKKKQNCVAKLAFETTSNLDSTAFQQNEWFQESSCPF